MQINYGICTKDGDGLFKLWLAEYMNSNMRRLGWTYKRTERETGVPQTTLYSYAQGRVMNPDEENLVRIVRAFGDDPEIIQRMRRESLESTTRENQLIAESTDKKRMEEFAALMRQNMAAILEEYRLSDAARQTEIIQHADARVESERQAFAARTEEVVRQCKEEMARKDEDCRQQLALMREHCDQRVADMQVHMQDVLAEKAKAKQELIEQYTRTIAGQDVSISGLRAAVALLVLTNALFGAYAFFAYGVFDMADPSRGLHRDAHTFGTALLFFAAALAIFAVTLSVSALLRRRKLRKKESVR